MRRLWILPVAMAFACGAGAPLAHAATEADAVTQFVCVSPGENGHCRTEVGVGVFDNAEVCVAYGENPEQNGYKEVCAGGI